MPDNVPPRQFLRRVWVEEFPVEKVNALMSSVLTRLKQCRTDGEENQLSWVMNSNSWGVAKKSIRQIFLST